MENFPHPESKSETVTQYTIEGIEDRPMVLESFDSFLRSQQEHRNGDYAVSPLLTE